MAHWPTIAATTALAAFVVAGALIHGSTSPAAFGVTVATAGATAGGATGSAAALWATPGDGPQMAPQKADAAGPGNPHRMALAGSGAGANQPPAAGPARSQALPAAALQRAGSGVAGAAGDGAQVRVLPDGGASSRLRPPVPVTSAPLPPVPPLAPVPPGVPGSGMARASAPAVPVLPAGPQPSAPDGPAPVPARMAVAMPLSIPALGPLDPARIGGAARELAEAVHVLASQAGGRALAAEQAAAGARKQSGGCPRETGPRPASLRDSICDKAGL